MPEAPTRPSRLRRTVFGVSLLGNIGLLVGLGLVLGGAFDRETELRETHYAGDKWATDKVAIVRVAGMLLEGSNTFAFQQIEAAAKDPAVKAVVLRVDSPGGTIGASDHLHLALTELRAGTSRRYAGTGPKPLTASFGSVAASGGYYIAMPCPTVYAEPTTITGSIGVFAALPNVSGLAERNGVKLHLVKAGAIKGGGSPLHPFTPADRQPWQDIVDNAYDRFLAVVIAGRPQLSREKLTQDVTTRVVPHYDDRGNLVGTGVTLTRYRADGGSYTPPQALQLGLIDSIADLPDVVNRAAAAAGLTRWRAVRYEEPKSWAEWATGVKVGREPPSAANLLARLAAPRVMYLSPQYGLVAAPGAGE